MKKILTVLIIFISMSAVIAIIEIGSLFTLYVQGKLNYKNDSLVKLFPIQMRINEELLQSVINSKIKTTTESRDFVFDPVLHIRNRNYLTVYSDNNEIKYNGEGWWDEIAKSNKNAKWIVTLGGSTTASSQKTNWPAHLIKEFRSNGVDNKIAVLNAGHNGYSLAQEYIYWAWYILPNLRSRGISPTTILTLDGVNDVSTKVGDLIGKNHLNYRSNRDVERDRPNLLANPKFQLVSGQPDGWSFEGKDMGLCPAPNVFTVNGGNVVHICYHGSDLGGNFYQDIRLTEPSREVSLGAWVRAESLMEVGLFLTAHPKEVGSSVSRLQGDGKWHWMEVSLSKEDSFKTVRPHINMTKPGRVEIHAPRLVSGGVVRPESWPPDGHHEDGYNPMYDGYSKEIEKNYSAQFKGDYSAQFNAMWSYHATKILTKILPGFYTLCVANEVPDWPDTLLAFLGDYKKNNILRFNEMYLGIPQRIGPINIEDFYKLPPEVIYSKSLSGLVNQIDKVESGLVKIIDPNENEMVKRENKSHVRNFSKVKKIEISEENINLLASSVENHLYNFDSFSSGAHIKNFHYLQPIVTESFPDDPSPRDIPNFDYILVHWAMRGSALGMPYYFDSGKVYRQLKRLYSGENKADISNILFDGKIDRNNIMTFDNVHYTDYGSKLIARAIVKHCISVNKCGL